MTTFRTWHLLAVLVLPLLTPACDDAGGDADPTDTADTADTADTSGGPTTLVHFCDVYTEAEFGALIGADVTMTPGASDNDSKQRCDIVSSDGSVNFTVIVNGLLNDDWATGFETWKTGLEGSQVVRALDWAADGELRRTTEEFDETPPDPPRVDTTVDLMVLAVEPSLYFSIDAATGDNPSTPETALDPDQLESAMETAAQTYAQALIDAN